MTMWDFIDQHPTYTFFLGIWVVIVISYPVRLVNRVIRHANVRTKGWPPPHLDADGDFKRKPESEA